MIDPQDKQTNSLPLDSGTQAGPGVPDITQMRREARLNQEFDLVRVTAPVYVLDKKKAAERSAGADRVAKHREKLAAEGLRQAAVPASWLEEVKAAGGWEEWRAKTTAAAAAKATEEATAAAAAAIEKAKAAEAEAKAAAAAAPLPAPAPVEKLVEVRVEVPGPERVVTVEKTVEVPVELSESDLAALEIGRKAQCLKGWKAFLRDRLI